MSAPHALAPALGALGAGGAGPDIRDIRGPIAIPSVWPTVLLVAGALAGALVVAAVVVAVVRRVRRSRLKTPAQTALERLEQARSLAMEGHAAELGEVISETVRAYVEARFDLRAPKRTTEEFLHDLASANDSPVARHRDALAAFLGACDLAMFARFAIDVEHQLAMIDAAVAFVNATAAATVATAPARAPGPPSVLTPEEARS
ncbi:MAG TPA: DUF4381 family protein [Polyangiaceae bacterium]|nr:DUF4381 family protein [Polyangiaceae bacterium]